MCRVRGWGGTNGSAVTLNTGTGVEPGAYGNRRGGCGYICNHDALARRRRKIGIRRRESEG